MEVSLSESSHKKANPSSTFAVLFILFILVFVLIILNLMTKAGRGRSALTTVTPTPKETQNPFKEAENPFSQTSTFQNPFETTGGGQYKNPFEQLR